MCLHAIFLNLRLSIFTRLVSFSVLLFYPSSRICNHVLPKVKLFINDTDYAFSRSALGWLNKLTYMHVCVKFEFDVGYTTNIC